MLKLPGWHLSLLPQLLGQHWSCGSSHPWKGQQVQLVHAWSWGTWKHLLSTLKITISYLKGWLLSSGNFLPQKSWRVSRDKPSWIGMLQEVEGKGRKFCLIRSKKQLIGKNRETNYHATLLTSVLPKTMLLKLVLSFLMLIQNALKSCNLINIVHEKIIQNCYTFTFVRYYKSYSQIIHICLASNENSWI